MLPPTNLLISQGAHSLKSVLLQAGVMRAAVEALGQVTAAMDPTDWPAGSGPLQLSAWPFTRPPPQGRALTISCIPLCNTRTVHTTILIHPSYDESSLDTAGKQANAD